MLIIDTSERAKDLEARGFTKPQVEGLLALLRDYLDKITQDSKESTQESTELQASKNEVALAQHKVETQSKMETLRQEVHELRVEMTEKFAEMERLIQTSFRMALMWMVATQIGGLGLMTAIVLGLR